MTQRGSPLGGFLIAARLTNVAQLMRDHSATPWKKPPFVIATTNGHWIGSRLRFFLD
jgi:hypothetical protein